MASLLANLPNLSLHVYSPSGGCMPPTPRAYEMRRSHLTPMLSPYLIANHIQEMEMAEITILDPGGNGMMIDDVQSSKEDNVNKTQPEMGEEAKKHRLPLQR